MLPIGTFGPWAPTQPPPRNLLTVLTDGEQNVTRRRHAAKPKLKVRKTRIADENKHPSSSNGTFASFFRTTSSESSYVSATSQRSSDPLQKVDPCVASPIFKPKHIDLHRMRMYVLQHRLELLQALCGHHKQLHSGIDHEATGSSQRCLKDCRRDPLGIVRQVSVAPR